MFPFLQVCHFFIPMYGLCIVSGIFFASLIWVNYAKKTGLIWEDGIVLGFSGILFGFIGAKLMYVFITFPFPELLGLIAKNEWKFLYSSGFVFYGGLIFGLTAGYVVSYFTKIETIKYEKGIIPLIPLVHSFGRLGCLFAGCCYGKATSSLIAVKYYTPLSDAPIGVPLMPVQLYEAIFNIFLFVILLFCRKKPKIILPLYLCLYSAGRFVMEFLRDDKIRGSIASLSTSQLISIIVFLIGVFVFILRFAFRKRDERKSEHVTKII